MRRIAATVAAGVLVVAAGAAQAGTITLDQYYPGPALSGLAYETGGRNRDEVAQTFTAGLTGTISRVDVFVGYRTGPSAQLAIEIRPTVSGVPDASLVLGTAYTSAGNNEWRSVDFALANIAIAVNTTYAIVFRSPTGNGSWVFTANASPQYTRGALFVRSSSTAWATAPGDYDAHFRVFVDVPDAPVVPLPSAAWMGLGLLGGLGIVARLRGRRRPIGVARP